jgi:1,4-dihydroxy-2-naphthoate octaprenyltransferase
MTTREQWIAGARPKTLAAAIAPVLVGSAIAKYEGSFSIALSLLALVVALALQVGVNYANDYSDGIRGTDNDRVGPIRLVGQGLATPVAVKRAAFICFGLAVAAGLGMLALSRYWLLLPVGISAVVAAWFYTGGKRPYGYAGFGEVFVFVYFGLVAVIGTSASQVGRISSTSLFAGIACGAFATAILVANNLRDLPKDALVGKRTLAVRLGDKATRELFRICILVGFIAPVLISFTLGGPEYAYIGTFFLLIARRALIAVADGATGAELIPVLVQTSQVLLFTSMSMSLGIWMS